MADLPGPRDRPASGERGATQAVILLIAHGSRHPGAATDHEATCSAVAKRSGMDVRPAYLELSPPSIPDAIDAAVAGGATELRLVPFFLHLGNHVRRDLPAIVDEARVRHPAVAIELDEHTGADPAIVDLVATRLRAPHPR